MNKRPNPELIDEDNPEWTGGDFKRAVPFSGLPASLQRKLRGPQRAPTKQPALQDWLKSHNPA